MPAPCSRPSRSLLGLGGLLVLGAVACGEDALLRSSGGGLQVEPSELRFGAVAEGSSDTRPVVITNPGALGLNVRVELAADGSPDFTVDLAPIPLAPRAIAALEVRFTPVGLGEDRGVLRLVPDDPEVPAVEVALVGGPIGPRLEVDPDPVEFAPAAAVNRRAVLLSNAGTARLVVDAVGLDPAGSPDFEAVLPALPLVLDPGARYPLELVYTRSGRREAGRLVIRSNQPDRPERTVRLVPDPLAACENGLDDDADGLADFPDDPGCAEASDDDETNPPECGPDGRTEACGLDEGVCELGQRSCAGGRWGPCEGGVMPGTERCNGLDDDCDGRRDEDVTETCTVHGCGGARRCVEGSTVAAGLWGPCTPLSPEPEMCNGLDDDCDGLVDEEIVEVCVVFGCPGARACVPESSGQFTECRAVSGSPEVCNGMDDDCDGVADEGLGELSCGRGACTATVAACVGGVPGTCVPGVPGVEVCNGVDDDCDGMADEGLGSLSCGRGACERTVAACELGLEGRCVPGTPVAELCNGLDDDCDGVADDGLGVLSCGRGVCTATVAACVNGTDGVCVPGTPGVEVCNGLDDDCDGTPDDGLGTLSCGVGACTATVAACVGGGPGVCVPGAPGVEACNGRDDDCDGRVDEDLPELRCGVGVCTATAAACAAGIPGTCTPGTPGVEVCNGLDDDCDGTPDDGLGTLSCGVGVCARAVAACLGGMAQTCVPGAPGPELCNGLDDDCDTLVDEEGVCANVCGTGALTADAQEPNNARTAPNPVELMPAAGSRTYTYRLNLTPGDRDFIQFTLPTTGSSADFQARVTCATWTGAGCGATAPSVGLQVCYTDPIRDLLGMVQCQPRSPGTAGLASVSDNGPIAGSFAPQRWILEVSPSVTVCAGEALQVEIEVVTDAR